VTSRPRLARRARVCGVASVLPVTPNGVEPWCALPHPQCKALTEQRDLNAFKSGKPISPADPPTSESLRGGHGLVPDRAAYRTWVRPPLPAVSAQHPADLDGRRAWLLCDVLPAVPERFVTGFDSGVVPLLVVPGAICRVVELTVELDHHAIGGVGAVTVALGTVRFRERHLPVRLGKPMSTLNIALVPVLEDRAITSDGGMNHVTEEGSPAEPPPQAPKKNV